MNIAVLGYGVVGKGVVKIADDLDEACCIRTIFGRPSRQQEIGERFEADFTAILNDPQIDIVVEVLGGYDFAYECITAAIRHRKHVVSANKEVVSRHLDELTRLARDHDVAFHYEASVGGGIPMLHSLIRTQAFNEITHIEGILNGTTNFILTQMQQHGSSLSDAVASAQNIGLAERDPRADIEGLDLLRKVRILAQIAFLKDIEPDQIVLRGLQGISPEVIAYADQQGYVIKLLADLADHEAGISIRCEPVLLPQNHLFARVKDEANVLRIATKHNGILTWMGPGAGSEPTASAIISDCLYIADKHYYAKPENKSTQVANTTHVKDCSFLVVNQGMQIVKNPSQTLLAEAAFYARIGTEAGS